MELRQLEYFREIASTGSINEAARHLNMSQPPLSYQIRQLENELNVKLFDRTSKGVTLTEAGKLLYDRSGNLLEKTDPAYRSDSHNCRYHHALYFPVFEKKSRREL